MWRWIYNLPRALRHQIHGPRASAGVCVEEDQSPDNFDVKNKQQQSYSCFNRAQDDHKERSQQGSKCDRIDFWSLVHGPNSGFEILGWGGTLVWAYHYSRLHWFEHKKREERCRFHSLLYKVAYAVTGEGKTFTDRNNALGLPSSSPSKSPGTDVKKQEDSTQVHTFEEDPLARAMSNFEDLCKQYIATGKSVVGLAHAEKGSMQAAIQHWQEASELGYAKAQFNLAVCYETGNGVKKDLKKAMEYYHLAAEENHPMSLYNLGVLYLEGGEDVQVNKHLGIKYLEKSAELGLAMAQTYLGVYYTEKGSKEDMKIAVEYFKKASEKNDPEAQYSLGLCYEEGWGVEPDECKAAQLYSQAAQSGHDGAMYNLGIFQQYGLGGLPEDLVSAKELFKKAAAAENESAKLQLQELEAMESIKEWKELNENKQPPPKDKLTRPGHLLRMNSSFSSPNLTDYVKKHMSRLGFSTSEDLNSVQQISSKPESIMTVKFDSVCGGHEKVIFTLGPDEDELENQTPGYLEDLAGYEMNLQSAEESRRLPRHCSMLQRNSTMPDLQFVTCS
ncbi:hypothetical protein ACJMK2_032588 [Sinanodonta woodiana]|uniref:Death ligand signal enhancer n=1 Tax=Sinanodonta woodiana TaxID=1069815 RepID=A0ABD3X2D4_SINWO